METKSVTIRIPVDLLKALEEKTEKGKRSELIIHLLREGLGLPTRVPQDGMQHIGVLEKVAELENLINKQYDDVTQRLTKLETQETQAKNTPSLTDVLHLKGEDEWMTTREAHAICAPEMTFKKFSALGAEKICQKCDLEADLDRRKLGSNKSRWLRQRP